MRERRGRREDRLAIIQTGTENDAVDSLQNVRFLWQRLTYSTFLLCSTCVSASPVTFIHRGLLFNEKEEEEGSEAAEAKQRRKENG